jgi:putative ABC transport system substrate-binding protein
MKGDIYIVFVDETRRAVGWAALVLLLVASPLTSEAQQPSKIARIGYLSPLSAAADSSYTEAFRQGLRTLGYIEGQNAVIEARYADSRPDRLTGLAAELVRLNVDVIVASPTPAVRAAQQATRTTPIVMVSGDPVGEGFVVGLARPGGNITGHATAVAEIAAKRVEFLKAIVPRLSHVAHLAAQEVARATVTQTEAAGRSLGLQVTTIVVRSATEVDQAFLAMREKHVGAVVVSLTLRPHWNQIVGLAHKSRLPTISGPREFAEAGGLMAYGPNYPDLFRRAAIYVDKILKGAKPAELPVEQPTTFELAINLKTAKAFGMTIPQSVLLQADQVLE